MSKSILKAAVAAACITAMSGAALADEMSANVGFVSDYQYRGYSQTNENMALQGGFDYAHDSGLYVGVWGSSIDWLSKGGLEVDVYGGYANSIGDFGYDVGVLQYFYPGGKTSAGDDADTTAAVCGQIAGVFYGASGIPNRWLQRLAMREEITDLADRLHDRALRKGNLG